LANVYISTHIHADSKTHTHTRKQERGHADWQKKKTRGASRTTQGYIEKEVFTYTHQHVPAHTRNVHLLNPAFLLYDPWKIYVLLQQLQLKLIVYCFTYSLE